MGAEARLYLQKHSIPQLFESLITGLIYTKPDDPIRFLESALAKVRRQPEIELNWDTFIEAKKKNDTNQTDVRNPDSNSSASRKSPIRKTNSSSNTKSASSQQSRSCLSKQIENRTEVRRSSSKLSSRMRTPSVMKMAEIAEIPDVPIILFIGGPGGGKTRHAARIREALESHGLVHICMPDMIRAAIAKYRDHFPEWNNAAERYRRGNFRTIATFF
ncbi:hypothetical protein AB6A40_006303 [Gnathostoma spinigerum]|uniref:Uncharacterized protein n=1 Tax=Gnathostoma spinigerum TaxID=75299 RepID=A0ABD6EQN6_9BILA